MIFLIVKPIDLNSIIKKYIKLCTKYNSYNCNLINNNIWGIGLAEVFPKEYMNDMIEYKFEDITVKGMKNADSWLTIRYGDYMKYPPQEEQINHGIKAWVANENE